MGRATPRILGRISSFLAHQSRNNAKSDYLAAENHLLVLLVVFATRQKQPKNHNILGET